MSNINQVRASMPRRLTMEMFHAGLIPMPCPRDFRQVIWELGHAA
jgi:hypothetical protein